ncbi:DUF2269 family protein [Pseudomonas cannabina]|uniref:Integral membrane protein n=3 Tax=Pseudomonas syringae group TaxID=136849 RepID=A0A3M3Q395_PSECA|nr:MULTISPECIES: DUF2269 family protein [Pseudomonas syringae group]KPB72570.1 Uncharacterized protein AC507_2567 [Pseudomonas syringae pv. maculicola]KPW18001.1 Uncharacterized protein ALO83_00577 [Pseudomonas cannabina pv. alisalensis]MBM0141393.1 DUF2269 family protein [Pseudomonas cannabina pv. alisalensis]QHE99713.1 DUF2269 family protein [Pseudomonas syringae pv. maculicola str. ES4326]QQN21752.1 DUF2269 family protein [Pseudomonas cannabina pv. alisalensis]
MESITALTTLHIAAITLLLISALVLASGVIKVRLEGDATIQHRLLKRPLVFFWALMVVCLATLPFSGWWLVHLKGLSLGQTWVLGSSVLYTVGLCSWVWLVVRLNRLRLGTVKSKRGFTLALSVISALCFVALAGLMGFKPA